MINGGKKDNLRDRIRKKIVLDQSLCDCFKRESSLCKMKMILLLKMTFSLDIASLNNKNTNF